MTWTFIFLGAPRRLSRIDSLQIFDGVKRIDIFNDEVFPFKILGFIVDIHEYDIICFQHLARKIDSYQFSSPDTSQSRLI